MIRYSYNAQKQPAAPFVQVTLRHPHTGAEVANVPAQLDTGADQSLLPLAFVKTLGLYMCGTMKIAGVGGSQMEMDLYDVLLSIHNLPPQRLEVLAHADESWVLLGRDVLNAYRLLLDGPNLALEIG